MQHCSVMQWVWTMDVLVFRDIHQMGANLEHPVEMKIFKMLQNSNDAKMFCGEYIPNTVMHKVIS